MDLLPTSEQQQIIDSAVSYLGDRLPLQRLKGLPPHPEVLSAALWKELADLGWLGLGIAEAAGGVGSGPSEEVLLLRELGRVIAPPRILFSIMAAHVAAAAGDQALTQRIVEGDLPVALAIREDFQAIGPALGLRRLYDIPGAAAALAIDGDEARLLDLANIALPNRPCLDSSIGMSVADLSEAPILCRVSNAEIGLRGALLLAAYEVGLAERALAMIVDYAKIRQTFGRPIGAYQAVRHPCAEMSARAEEARAQVFLASVTLADGSADATVQVCAARVLADTAATQNTDDNIQLHGGIGVTEEFDAHHLMKRATVAPQWFGDHRSYLMRVLTTPLNLDVLT